MKKFLYWRFPIDSRTLILSLYLLFDEMEVLMNKTF